jgi:hypothetical protein
MPISDGGIPVIEAAAPATCDDVIEALRVQREATRRLFDTLNAKIDTKLRELQDRTDAISDESHQTYAIVCELRTAEINRHQVMSDARFMDKFRRAAAETEADEALAEEIAQSERPTGDLPRDHDTEPPHGNGEG